MNKLSPRLLALIETIAEAPRAMLLLDFDGTLAPIRSRPDLAHIDDELRAVLRELHHEPLRLAVVSGRALGDLRERVGLPDIGYGGVFGLELREPGWKYTHPHAAAVRPALVGVLRELEVLFKDVPGVRLEDKGVGLALHYRNVPHDHAAEFSRRLKKARGIAPPGLRWRRGQRNWEVTPNHVWNKGRAVLALWRRHNKPLLLAVGDDRFDESMFRITRRRGASIKVGPGPTCATHRLDDPAHVAVFLRALAERVAGRRLLSGGKKAAHRRPVKDS